MMNLSYIRNYSGPFDWCYGSDLKNRVKFLIDDFKNFFNKEDFIRCSSELNNDVFKNKRTNIIYNHDFSLNCNFNKEFPKVLQKYQRRIKRMLNILNNKRVLLIYMSLPNPDKTDNDKDILLCSKKIKKKFPNSDFLYIRHNESLNDGDILYTRLSDSCIVLDIFNYERNVSIPVNTVNRKNALMTFGFIKINPNNYIKNIKFKKKSKIISKFKHIIYHKNLSKHYTRILFLRFYHSKKA